MNNIIKIINSSEKILIAVHINPDGDTIGSALALYQGLISLGKDVSLISHNDVPSNFEFLKFSEKIIKPSLLKSDKIDLAIALDTASKDRLGECETCVFKADKVINIDHHISNTKYADINYIDAEASCVGEIIYMLLKEMNIKITQSIADALYVSIVTDTGSFVYTNTTAKTFQAVQELLKSGINLNEIYNKVYNTRSFKSYKLLAKALDSLKFENGIGYMVIDKTMFDETKTTPHDTDDFINYIRSIKEVDIAIIFKEYKENEIKISFRSKTDFDVNKLAQKYGGGGHAKAAGCTLEGTIEKISAEIILSISEP